VNRDDALKLLRGSRACIDTLVALTGEEDPEFQEAAFDVAHDILVRLDRFIATEDAGGSSPDPGGPTVWSAMPDDLPEAVQRSIRDRVAPGVTSESPDRIDPVVGRSRLKSALVEAIIAAVQSEDRTLPLVLSALLMDLGESGRVEV